jgi:hypothetical protein
MQCLIVHLPGVDLFAPDTEELLDAWRDAQRAAELAERLAAAALEAAERADRAALSSEDVADLADAASAAAERASRTAREVATRARALATDTRHVDLAAADHAATSARARETDARDAYERSHSQERGTASPLEPGAATG